MARDAPSLVPPLSVDRRVGIHGRHSSCEAATLYIDTWDGNISVLVTARIGCFCLFPAAVRWTPTMVHR